MSALATRPAGPARAARTDPEPSGFYDAEQFPRAERFGVLREHGDFTLAYNTAAQPGLAYFRHAGGYLAFATAGNVRFVLGDPVVAPDRRADLLHAFLRDAGEPVFCEVTAPTAAVLESAGFFLNDMGPDHRLDLATYDFRGKQKEWLRYAANWCARRDYRIGEAGPGDLTAGAMREVSEAWRATRPTGHREVTFLNRPLSDDPEPGVRRFTLRDPGGALLAFFVFDPLYRGGEAFGYVTCIKRRRPESPNVGEAAVMKHAIDVFKAEGRETLRLGLSPFADGKTPEFRENKLLAQTFRLTFSAGWVNRRYYAVENHTAYKRRFRGEEERTYFASRRWFNMKPLYLLANLMGLTAW